jgi:hypothetical protein
MMILLEPVASREYLYLRATSKIAKELGVNIYFFNQSMKMKQVLEETFFINLYGLRVIVNFYREYIGNRDC